MGQFRIEITAVGPHGCTRGAKDGETVYGCGRMGCPDCQARDFVDQLRRRGCSIEAATFTHWPGTDGQVVDDLVSGIRKGAF